MKSIWKKSVKIETENFKGIVKLNDLINTRFGRLKVKEIQIYRETALLWTKQRRWIPYIDSDLI